MKALTRDLGIAIRDALEDENFHILKEEEGELIESGQMVEITVIDVSDPDNPIVELENGQQFIIRIIAA